MSSGTVVDVICRKRAVEWLVIASYLFSGVSQRCQDRLKNLHTLLPWQSLTVAGFTAFVGRLLVNVVSDDACSRQHYRLTSVLQATSFS